MSPGGRDPTAIRHGVALPTGGNPGSELLAIGRNLERLGFDSLWVSEVDSDPAPPRDALAICSALGVVTAEIGLVALLAAGSRLPAVAAKAASGTDRMCGGRLALGLREGAADIRATLDGRGPPNLPPPVGPVPLWLTGDHTHATEAAVRLADGWFVGWNQDTSRSSKQCTGSMRNVMPRGGIPARSGWRLVQRRWSAPTSRLPNPNSGRSNGGGSGWPRCPEQAQPIWWSPSRRALRLVGRIRRRDMGHRGAWSFVHP